MPGRIWVRPAAARGSGPAMASGSPALSRKTTASSVSGSIPAAAAAFSICGRQRSTRFAVAATPPGDFA